MSSFCICCLSSRAFLPLYLFWSCLTLGWIVCIAAIDRNCLIVSGRITSRTVNVSRMMQSPHDAMWSW